MKACAAICLIFTTSATAQTTRAPFVINNNKDFHRYALYCPKREYPINLRERRIAGSGTFLLHLRRDGTVESVETLSCTGYHELDAVAKDSFIKWRFRPGPTAAKVPITFKPPNGGSRMAIRSMSYRGACARCLSFVIPSEVEESLAIVWPCFDQKYLEMSPLRST